MMHYLHTASRRIIELLVARSDRDTRPGPGIRVFKQAVELGKKHNQEFVHIPHARISGAAHPTSAEALGILAIVTEESYTSQASLPSPRMCCPAMIPLKGPSRKTSRVSLAAAMAEGHVSKGVRLSIPM